MRPRVGGATPRLFFYVQHLLGIGHLHRAARIARALASNGFEVLVALGGVPYPGIAFGNAATVQLLPVQAGPEGFSALVQADGSAFETADADRRARHLLDEFDRFGPDVLLTEAFPFGRSQMRFELLPLLDYAKSRLNPPLIVSSVRDILQRNRRPERVNETLHLVDRYFDSVLVHGDPNLTSLDHSFPLARSFAAKVIYTGIVAPEPIGRADGPARFAAVVSAGGGAVGSRLIEMALSARPMTRIADRPWLVLTGPNVPRSAPAMTGGVGDGSITVKRFVPDLAQVLAETEISISQAGYNTVADILAAGCRAVVVPFSQAGETEQGDRAALLQHRGLAISVSEQALSPATLAAAIDSALERPRGPATSIALDGAIGTVRALWAAWEERQRDVRRHRM